MRELVSLTRLTRDILSFYLGVSRVFYWAIR